MNKFTATTLGLWIISLPLLGKINQEAAAKKIIQQFELDMWRVATAHLLHVPTEMLAQYDNKEALFAYIRKYDCQKTSCQKEQLLEYATVVRPVNIFMRLAAPSKSEAYALSDLYIDLKQFKNRELTDELEETYQKAAQSPVLRFLQNSDNQLKKQALLEILKGLDQQTMSQLRQIQDIAKPASRISCEDYPIPCSFCCLVIKKVIPLKLAFLKHPTSHNRQSLFQSLIDVKTRMDDGTLDQQTIDNIMTQPAHPVVLNSTVGNDGKNFFLFFLLSLLAVVGITTAWKRYKKIQKMAYATAQPAKTELPDWEEQESDQTIYQDDFNPYAITDGLSDSLEVEEVEPEVPSTTFLQTFYAARLDGSRGFSVANLSANQAHKLPFVIEVLDKTTATYRIVDDLEIQKQALNNAYYVLDEACNYRGSATLKRGIGIVNLKEGRLLLEGEEWVIVEKLEIGFN